ncbi:hypothetical protein, partial [Photobacterium lipolyticum]|uniref:hypothetical protein n=1 Tax=Photobacterium lipolyticum TaxID=266810 RepID=UPI001B875138
AIPLAFSFIAGQPIWFGIRNVRKSCWLKVVDCLPGSSSQDLLLFQLEDIMPGQIFGQTKAA